MMRKGLVLIGCLLIGHWTAFAASVELWIDCQSLNESGITVYLGYNASETIPAVSTVELMYGADVVDLPPEELEAGEHHRVFSVNLQSDGGAANWQIQGVDVFAALMVRNDGAYPPCDEWQPETTSVLIPAPDGQYIFEVRDHYGHWSVVTDRDHPTGIIVQAQNGSAELIVSPDGESDPADYRLKAIQP